MAVDLVLNRLKERSSVVDKCDDNGCRVINTISFDQCASDFECRFVRKQVFVQISSLYLVIYEYFHVAGIVGKTFDVFNLGDRVVLDGRLQYV